MKVFFLVLARDEKNIGEKVEELKHMGMPYLIVCGKDLHRANIIYREPRGKYDAINFGFESIPKDTDVVVLNDVDTEIMNFEAALHSFRSRNVGLLFAKVHVEEGPQRLFYTILDGIRRKLLITASGELMLIKYNLLERIVPIRSCKAEDTYILLKVLEAKQKCAFCEECYVITKRTKSSEKEEMYKRRTVSGIYQALAYTKPPNVWRLFYAFLPIVSPLLLITGKKGYFWTKGILLGLLDYLRGDQTGLWQPTH